MKTGPKPNSFESAWQQLLARVVKRDSCWLIEDGRSVGIGYKRIRANGYEWYAHQLAYFIINGAVPLGTVHRHTCDRPNCINPDHIIIGTHADNVDDKVSRNRHPKGDSHYNAKLTSAAVREIRLSTEPLSDLARKFNITVSAVRAAKDRKTWKSVK